MKNWKVFLSSLCLAAICLQAIGQTNEEKKKPNFKTKYFASCEVISIGPEFLTGEIDETLDPGMQIALFPTHFSSYKNPNIYIGAGLYFGQHKFSPTGAEKNIIDNYAIVTTTTNQFGTTSTTEPLEEITITRFGIGIPVGYQTLDLDKKVSFLVGVIPLWYKFSNGLKGDDYKKTQSGFGIAGQVGLNYQLKGSTMIRVSYIHGTIPDFSLYLLSGLRSVNGPGTYGTLQVGLVFRNINKELI